MLVKTPEVRHDSKTKRRLKFRIRPGCFRIKCRKSPCKKKAETEQGARATTTKADGDETRDTAESLRAKTFESWVPVAYLRTGYRTIILEREVQPGFRSTDEQRSSSDFSDNLPLRLTQIDGKKKDSRAHSTRRLSREAKQLDQQVDMD